MSGGILTIDGEPFEYLDVSLSIHQRARMVSYTFTGLEMTKEFVTGAVIRARRNKPTAFEKPNDKDHLDAVRLAGKCLVLSGEYTSGTNACSDVWESSFIDQNGIRYTLHERETDADTIARLKAAGLWPEPERATSEPEPLNITEIVLFEMMQKLSAMDASIKSSPTHWQVFEWYAIDKKALRQMNGATATITRRRRAIEDVLGNPLSVLHISQGVFRNVKKQLSKERHKQQMTNEDDFS